MKWGSWCLGNQAVARKANCRRSCANLTESDKKTDWFSCHPNHRYGRIHGTTHRTPQKGEYPSGRIGTPVARRLLPLKCVFLSREDGISATSLPQSTWAIPDPMPTYSSVAIIGVGLIGGSIGLALRQRQLAGEVVGIGRSEESLRHAEARGAVHRITTDLSAGVAEAEIVVVCSPVPRIVSHILATAAACPANTLITDVGSTKAEIIAAVEAVARNQRSEASQRQKESHPTWTRPGGDPDMGQDGPTFVGSHPLAGDHRTGVGHARADLFEDRTVVVTPTNATPPGSVERARLFWHALGARVCTLGPDEHDRLVAATSHVPHLVAAAVVASTPLESLPLTATGWRDVTRIAAGDPSLWEAIIATNRQNILDALCRVEWSLAEFRDAIVAGDHQRLAQLLTEAKQIRENARE
ncbi:MAG: prephenate dehydrogenase/arogenate dehydrogenase family protein [Pirellulales bacterium]|nr:prephenate dehydrogenase/arogenate dehydrogenase family protein [Pirellulales bacterium]